MGRGTIRLRTYQIGSPRKRSDGLRVGTVRFLPRGVRKHDYARLDYFDVCLPSVAPSQELIRWLKSADLTDKRWAQFLKRYEHEMTTTNSRQTIQLLAEIAKRTPISIGCYCADESRCHRSTLRKLIDRAATG
jgi:uncharacterized protein YeaO (DUF488 family)